MPNGARIMSFLEDLPFSHFGRRGPLGDAKTVSPYGGRIFVSASAISKAPSTAQILINHALLSLALFFVSFL